jgi:hypothetical protein
MIGLRDWSVGNRIALGVAAMVVIAVGSRLHAMRRTVSDGDVAVAERVVLPALPVAFSPSEDSLALAIAAAVGADPFQPRRTRPAVRFHARGGSTQDDMTPADSATGPAAPATSQPAAALTLQGIAHLANGNSLAVLSVGGGTAQILRVGQSLDQYHLIRVDSSSATLVGADSTVILHLRNVARSSKP